MKHARGQRWVTSLTLPPLPLTRIRAYLCVLIRAWPSWCAKWGCHNRNLRSLLFVSSAHRKAPIPTFPSWRTPRRSTRSCN